MQSIIALSALVGSSVVSQPASAECLASFREITFPDGSARVKNYICKTDGAAKPELRVEFDRLSEAAAGSLIQGTPYPDLERAFGKFRVARNAVAAETKKLFDQFGIKSVNHSCYAFEVAAAGGATYSNNRNANCGERTIWYLTFPDRLDPTTIQIALPSALATYRKSKGWPKGFSFNYQLTDECREFWPIACTLIWRSALPKDLDNFVGNWIAYNRMLGLPDDTPESIAEEANTPGSWYYTRKRYFSLVDYLTNEFWPDDFLFITGKSELCGSGLDFALHIRQLIMDVAFIQNVSGKPLLIDALLGNEVISAKLRKIVPSGTDRPQTHEFAFTGGLLQPGETIAVPLALVFVMSESLKAEFGGQADAKKAFERIRSANRNTVFQMPTEPGKSPIRKTRESFGAPTRPKPTSYVFGPELRLSGLVVDGKPIGFSQKSRNFMQLTAGEGYGSCPFLYAWSDEHQIWVRYGKVIDRASGADKEMTERKTFDGFRGRFRLAEEELEVAYIDAVALEVELHNGTGITLKPNYDSITVKDGHFATIKAGDRIEFTFTLPVKIKPKDVKRSTLAITGYYRRYGDLLTARQ